MIDSTQLVTYVIRPVLRQLELYSEEAEKLVLGTACVESECGRWLKQLESGPALGIYQCEPTTHDDIWLNFLKYRQELSDCVRRWMISDISGNLITSSLELMGNLYYATAMCRIHYYRVSDPIPVTLLGQAAYWKKYYNTHLGQGEIVDYTNAWNKFVPVGFYQRARDTVEV